MKIYDFFQQEWVDQYMNFGPCLGSQFDDKTGQIHISEDRETSEEYGRYNRKPLREPLGVFLSPTARPMSSHRERLF